MRIKNKGILKTVLTAFLLSILLSAAAVVIFNEVFRLYVPDKYTTCELTITLDGETPGQVGKLLGDGGIIRYPALYSFYCALRGDTRSAVSGSYRLTPSMSYDEIRSLVCSRASAHRQVSVTIPEGSTAEGVINILTSSGIGTREGYKEAMNSLDYDYDFVREIAGMPPEKTAARKYMLEGYMFPDTYYFFADSDEHTVIDKMLANFSSKFDSRYIGSASSQGFTVDMAVTLASVIEKEARYREDFKLVGSVFRNRLSSRSMRRLESDATVAYAVGAFDEGRAVTASELSTDSPYNTYKYEGLPPGAICNPGKRAFLSALEPAESDYYYFVSDSDGHVHYAKNSSGHKKNIERISKK